MRARRRTHPEMTDRSVFEVFEAGRPSPIAYPGPFDGFRATEVAVSKSSLVRLDHNRYSVAVRAARRPAQPRADADRVCRRLVRRRDRGRAPAALRARSDGVRPLALSPRARAQARRAQERPALPRLGPAAGPDPGPAALGGPRRRRPADRRYPGRRRGRRARCGGGGLPLEALEVELCSRGVVPNLLARRRQPPTPPPVAPPVRLAPALEPAADCGRYDALRQRTAAGGGR